MLIGVPKEIKNHEYRVGLAPSSVREVIAHGHDVQVQANAGEGIGATDDDYRSAGAVVIDDPSRIFNEVDMIVKVKEPLEQNANYFVKDRCCSLTFISHQTLSRPLIWLSLALYV